MTGGNCVTKRRQASLGLVRLSEDNYVLNKRMDQCRDSVATLSKKLAEVSPDKIAVVRSARTTRRPQLCCATTVQLPLRTPHETAGPFHVGETQMVDKKGPT